MGKREHIYEIIAENIRKERRRLGITQAELAERADVSLDTIKSVENGRRAMSCLLYTSAIPYSMVLELNLLNFVILFIVLQIIYCIYTSYSLKKIGIKKSMGFSTIDVYKRQP